MVIMANLAKISLISRYFLVFQVIPSHWPVEISQNHPKVVSYDILDKCQVLSNSIDRNMVKMGKLAKISLISRYFLVFKVISSDSPVEISQNLPKSCVL